MRNKTRNRLLLWASLTVCVACIATFVALMLEAEDRLHGRWWIPVIVTVAMSAIFLSAMARDNREMNRIEADLRAGDLEVPDEQPIPIKLASNRESLVVSLIMLALIIATFVAYFGGWIGNR